MLLSSDGSTLIRTFEGFSTTAYQDCVGVWTIGYGDTQLNGKPVKQGDIITQQQAIDMFNKRIETNFAPGVANTVHVQLKQNQFDALVSLTYNIGVGAFQASTLLKKLNNSDYFGTSEQFVVWNKAGGQFNAGLLARRAVEMRVFLCGYKYV